MKRNRSGISRVSKLLTTLLILLLLASLAAVPMYAKYIKQTNEIKNTFSHVDTSGPEIEEKFENNIKENVYVSVGETKYPVYVRATIVITWKKEVEVTDEDGNPVIGEDGEPMKDYIVYSVLPDSEKDYKLTLKLTENGWVYNEADGFYYYTQPVESKGTTGVLIERCEQRTPFNPPEGYFLSVEIIAQTVQAVGSTDDDDEYLAYQDAWNIDDIANPGHKDEGPTEGEGQP